MLPATSTPSSLAVQESLEELMKRIINMPQLKGFDLTSERLNGLLSAFHIYNVPIWYYQVMADCISNDKSPCGKRETGQRIQNILQEFLTEHFKGFQLESFADFSGVEAQTIHPNLHWGMWIKLLEPINQESFVLGYRRGDEIIPYDRFRSEGLHIMREQIRLNND